MYVCLCKGLTESDVRQCVRAGNTTPEALVAALGLNDEDNCGRCAREADQLLATCQSEWLPVRQATGRMLPVLSSRG